jgi:hypothetical protein
MVDAVVRTRRRSSLRRPRREYGLTDVCRRVPVKLSRGGVQRVIEIALTREERPPETSAGHVRGYSDLGGLTESVAVTVGRHFWLRRIHSLFGHRRSADSPRSASRTTRRGGGGRLQRVGPHFQRLPLRPGPGILIIIVDLLPRHLRALHHLDRAAESGLEPLRRNAMYFLQRVTGVIVLPSSSSS